MNEYSVISQFVREMFLDAQGLRKNVSLRGKLKDDLDDVDIRLMEAYLKPNFNDKDETAANRKLCERKIKVG